ncbi:MAG: UbiD family decarboxylase, partial [Planctomycetota bacterium]
RTYLDELTKWDPRQLKIVEDEVDSEFEATALVHKMERDADFPGFPAVLFKNIKGSPIPCLLNLHATYDRVAFALGTDVAGMVEEYAKREGSPIPTTIVPSEKAPVHEVVLTGDDIDVTKLPTLVHQELDAGRYITSAAAVSRDPDSGRLNAGIFRHQVQGPRQVGFMTNPAHQTSYILRNYRDRGERMEVALVLGHHMGGLLGQSVEMVNCKTIGLQVPAHAEIVIEGIVDTDPTKVQNEGPFGEYPLYYTRLGPMPWLQVTAVTMRKQPIYVDVFNAHKEHLVLGALPRMGGILRRVRDTISTTTAVNLPLMGIRSTLFISMKKKVDGEPKMAASAAFSVDPILKHIFVVDDDIDVYDNDQVLWAMTTRFQADRDLIVMPNFLGGHLNPVTYGFHREEKGPMETKMILDCTRPAPPATFPPACRVPPEVVERVNPGAVVKDWKPGADLFRDPIKTLAS